MPLLYEIVKRERWREYVAELVLSARAMRLLFSDRRIQGGCVARLFVLPRGDADTTCLQPYDVLIIDVARVLNPNVK